jgi:hypothetical protein
LLNCSYKLKICQEKKVSSFAFLIAHRSNQQHQISY